MHLEFRAHHDDGTAGVVHTLTEEVHTEATLLALEEFCEALERASRTRTRRAAAAVEQLVDGFLQHALFVAENHVRGTDVNQLFQAVVAVDDTAVEFVQVGGRKAAAFERNERTKIGRNHREHVENHPGRLVREHAHFVRILDTEFIEGIGQDEIGMLGFVVGLEFGDSLGETLEPGLAGIAGGIRVVVVAAEAFHLRLAEGVDHLQALDGIVHLRLGVGTGLVTELRRKLGEVEPVEQLLDSRSTHLGFERTAFGHEILVGRLVDEGVLLEFGIALVDHDIAFVVDDLFEVLGVEAKEGTNHARLVTNEPSVCKRNGEFDMAHAFATDAGVGHFDAAAVTDDTLVTGALELTAVAFPVLDGSKDLLAEETITFGLERTIVNRLRLRDFAVGPVANQVGRSQVNRNVAGIFLIFHHFFGHITFLQWSRYQDPKNGLRGS